MRLAPGAVSTPSLVRRFAFNSTILLLRLCCERLIALIDSLSWVTQEIQPNPSQRPSLRATKKKLNVPLILYRLQSLFVSERSVAPNECGRWTFFRPTGLVISSLVFLCTASSVARGIESNLGLKYLPSCEADVVAFSIQSRH